MNITIKTNQPIPELDRNIILKKLEKLFKDYPATKIEVELQQSEVSNSIERKKCPTCGISIPANYIGSCYGCEMED